MTNKEQLRKFLLWCSGTDDDVLENCTKDEQMKYVTLGALMLIPFTMAFASMAFLIISLTGKEFVWIAFIWALFIFLIDRFFLITIYKLITKTRLYYLSIALRIGLAIIIGYLIAHPLLLGIMKGSITEEFRNNQETVELENLRSNLETYNTRIAEIENTTNELDRLLLVRHQNSEPEERILEISREIVAQRAERFRTEALIDEIQNQIEDVRENRISNPSDIWQLTDAFDSLKSRNLKLRIYEFLIILLFMILDTIPILGKVFSTETNYDFILQSRKDEIKTFNSEFSKKRIEINKTRIDKYFSNQEKISDQLKSDAAEFSLSLAALNASQVKSQINSNPINNSKGTNGISILSRFVIVLLVLGETLFVLWRYDNNPQWIALPILTFSLSHFLFGPKN